MNRLIAVCGALLLTGCAGGYVSRTRSFRQAYESGDTQRALQISDKELKDAPEKDKLLVLFDRGMVLHAAGQYEESIKVLAEADTLSQQLDFVSVSETAATLVTDERERAYRGEDFEKLMITVLQALNYSALGKDEDALVEIRRVNERIQKMITEEQKPYEQLAIARYLGGVLYEDEGEEDNAFIDYYAAWKTNPKLGHLAGPLLRLAKKTGRDDAYEELKAAFPEMDPQPLRPGEGQVVVVVETGLSPEKEESTRRTRRDSGEVVSNAVPIYVNRWSHARARVAVDGNARQAITVTSLEDVAKTHLEDRIGRMILKSIAGTAVKAGLAAGVGALTNSQEAGLAAFALLSLFNHSDTRSWLSLPAEFQLARWQLPPGEHTVTVETPSGQIQRTVKVRAKRISVVTLRAY
ncbi:MAG: COG3014 family protein [Myxococcaceae bacterium]